MYMVELNAQDNDLLQCHYEPSNITLKQNNLYWKREGKKYISPYSLYQQIKAGTATPSAIIDIRTKKEYDKFHILGSYNLLHSSLKTKSIFKKYKIILVGNGGNYKYLENLYDELKKNGFSDLLILDGGIDFWKTNIESKRRDSYEYQLNNIDILISGDVTNWKIIDTSNNEKISEKYPAVIKILDNQAIYKPNVLVKTNQNKLIGNVLLVLTEKYNTKRIINLWQDSLKANVFVIDATKMMVLVNQYAHKQKQVSYKKRTDGAQLSCL